MVTVSNFATQIQNENNYTTSDISLANTEFLIDTVIDYINLMAGTSIADLSGSSGSKSITGSENEIATVKMHMPLLLKTYVDRGPNVTLSSLGVSTILQDSQYAVFKDFSEKAINQLRGRSFLRT